MMRIMFFIMLYAGFSGPSNATNIDSLLQQPTSESKPELSAKNNKPGGTWVINSREDLLSTLSTPIEGANKQSKSSVFVHFSLGQIPDQTWQKILVNDYGVPAVKNGSKDCSFGDRLNRPLRELPIALYDYEIETTRNGEDPADRLKNWMMKLEYFCNDARGKALVDAERRLLQDMSDALQVRFRAEAASNATADAVTDKRKQCLASQDYKLYELSLKIQQGVGKIRAAESALNRDLKIEETSGIIDLQTRHDAGSSIVDTKKMVSEAFPKYKNLGGSARKPEEVQAIDPCP